MASVNSNIIIHFDSAIKTLINHPLTNSAFALRDQDVITYGLVLLILSKVKPL